MVLAELVYRATARFPRSEQFGLTSQLRRAAVSIPCNIAGGAARNGSRELAQFLGVTCGSIAELETQLELAVRLGYLGDSADATRQMNRVGVMVRRLRAAVRQQLT